MTYIQFVTNYLKKQKIGNPIYIKDISFAVSNAFNIDKKKSSSASSIAMNRIINRKTVPNLRCYQKGIFYLTTLTPFGELPITKNMLIEEKYLSNDKGYKTGYRLLYDIGLTSQIPNEYLIATNVAKECLRHDNLLDVSICPPKTPIDKNNIAYLQILDAINLLNKAPVDADNPLSIIANYIEDKKLDFRKLLFYADRYYSKNTLIDVAHIATFMEVNV